MYASYIVCMFVSGQLPMQHAFVTYMLELFSKLFTVWSGLFASLATIILAGLQLFLLHVCYLPI